MEHVSNWLKANKLSLNIKKSNILIFRHKNVKQTDKIDVRIDGNTIDEKESAKYLGLYFDNKLTFGCHVDHVLAKLKKGNAILAKLRHFVPKNNVRNVYFAHIESHLNYGAVVWGSTASYHIDKITSAQKKSIKIMNFIKRRDHYDSPFKTNKILPFDRLRSLSMCKFVWKIKNNVIPIGIELLARSQVVTSERDNNKFLVPYKNTLYARRSLFYAGVLEWNKIPTKVKQCGVISAFSLNCKEFIFSKLHC